MTTSSTAGPTAEPTTPPTESTAPTPSTGHVVRRSVLATLATIAVVGLVGVAIGYLIHGSPPPPAPDSTLPAGPVDIGFAQDMLDHHDQAVQIASFAEAHATSPMVRAMATAVLGTQRYEIGLLEQFLHDHGSDRGDPNRTVMGWMGMPTPHAQMPGLQPTDKIVDFLNLQGSELDKQFLSLMIDHHQGGVHMAGYAADHAETSSLRQLASRMVVDQQTEIGDYQAALQSVS